NFNLYNYLRGKSSFFVIYSIILNGITITTSNTLVDTRANTNIIINLSFARKLRKLLKLPLYNNFNPRYITLYKQI
ncbi:hypothetical protein GE21DRAFT_1223686, partial [Neurospora crassa]